MHCQGTYLSQQCPLYLLTKARFTKMRFKTCAAKVIIIFIPFHVIREWISWLRCILKLASFYREEITRVYWGSPLHMQMLLFISFQLFRGAHFLWLQSMYLCYPFQIALKIMMTTLMTLFAVLFNSFSENCICAPRKEQNLSKLFLNYRWQSQDIYKQLEHHARKCFTPEL